MKKEVCEQKLGVVYGKIYNYTDTGGDSVLELMDDILVVHEKFDMLMEYVYEDRFINDYKETEYKELINVMKLVLDEVKCNFG
jgi:hypothetical protein